MDRLLEPPTQFERVAPDVVERAKTLVWDVLRDPATVDNLRAYYAIDGDFAGATFTEVLPIDDRSFTASDLFALTLLSVQAPSPRVSRQVLALADAPHDLNSLLSSSELTPELALADAGAETLTAMSELYVAAKQVLGRDPWVTASKLCARKRPRLFPVRDSLVRGLLDLTRYRNYQVHWQVFRAIASDTDLMAELQRCRDQATGDGVHIDAFPLRWLDVALWMFARAQ